MSEKKWREVTLDDLREMTQAERRLCRVRIGDVARGVYALDKGDVIWTLRKGLTRDWTEYELEHWDAVIEAPVPPSRPIPTHEDAVILVGDVMLFQSSRVGWFKASDSARYSRDEVQDSADKYGWVELVPADGPNAEDARAAGIREVEADFRAQRLFNTAARVRDRFPEAFSGAVNAKEIDDGC